MVFLPLHIYTSLCLGASRKIPVICINVRGYNKKFKKKIVLRSMETFQKALKKIQTFGDQVEGIWVWFKILH